MLRFMLRVCRRIVRSVGLPLGILFGRIHLRACNVPSNSVTSIKQRDGR